MDDVFRWMVTSVLDTNASPIELTALIAATPFFAAAWLWIQLILDVRKTRAELTRSEYENVKDTARGKMWLYAAVMSCFLAFGVIAGIQCFRPEPQTTDGLVAGALVSLAVISPEIIGALAVLYNLSRRHAIDKRA